MANTTSLDANPFVDPPYVLEQNGTDLAFTVDSTLVVGRDASLTLGTDALIVLGEAFSSLPLLTQLIVSIDESYEKGDGSNCCGLWTSGLSNTHQADSNIAYLLTA